MAQQSRPYTSDAVEEPGGATQPQQEYAVWEVGIAYAYYLEGVDSGEDAMNIAVAESGKKFAAAGFGAGIDIRPIQCPDCGTQFESCLHIIDRAFIGMLAEVEVVAPNEQAAQNFTVDGLSDEFENMPLQVRYVDFLGYPSDS